jgi:hypothetical protein
MKYLLAFFVCFIANTALALGPNYFVPLDDPSLVTATSNIQFVDDAWQPINPAIQSSISLRVDFPDQPQYMFALYNIIHDPQGSDYLRFYHGDKPFKGQRSHFFRFPFDNRKTEVVPPFYPSLYIDVVFRGNAKIFAKGAMLEALIVPEPSSILLLSIGLTVLCLKRRKEISRCQE